MVLTPQELAAVIDHTLLRPTATAQETEHACQQGLRWGCASVCVLPYYVGLAYSILRGSATAVCTVVGFPLGSLHRRTKLVEAEEALAQGARELDMVMNLAAFCSGDLRAVEQEISAVAAMVHRHAGGKLKVILECSLLSPEQQELAARLAAHAGADFVKTSTGFLGGGATVEQVARLRRAIPEHVAVKASGGIRTLEQALELLAAGAARLGTSATASLLEQAQQRVTNL